MHAIRVGKKWDKDAVYIGRGSPLGNPFVMKHEGQRDAVCDQYEEWFAAKVNANDPAVMRALEAIHARAKIGPVTLGCFCAPKRCHGETIKNFIEA